MSRYLAKIAILFLLFLIAALPLKAQNVYTVLNHDTLAVGDTLNYAIVTRQGQNVDGVIFPDSTAFGNLFSLKDRRIYKTSAESDSAVFTLQFFGVRDTTIQPLSVKFVTGSDTVSKSTIPIPIHFKSQIADKSNAQFKPLKPIYLFALSLLPYIIGLLVLAVIAYVLYRIYKRWIKEHEKPEETPSIPRVFEDPLKRLEEDLNLLYNDESLQQRAFKVFYSKLGDTLRGYFERLYKIPALESTSRELQRDLDTLAVDAELRNYTREILRQADMVKFAKFNPTLDRAHEDLNTGMKFLEQARKVDRDRVERERTLFEEEVRREEEERLKEKEEIETEEETVNPPETV